MTRSHCSCVCDGQMMAARTLSTDDSLSCKTTSPATLLYVSPLSTCNNAGWHGVAL